MTFTLFELFVFAFGLASVAGIAALAIGVRAERRRWMRRALLMGIPPEELVEMDDPAVAFSRASRSERLERQMSELGDQIDRLGQAVASRDVMRGALAERRSPIPPA